MLVIVLECLWMVWSCMPAIPILLTVDAGEQHQQNESSCKSDGTENIGGFQTPRKWSRSPLFIGYIPVRSHQCLNIESPVCAFISRSSSPRRVILAPPTWDILWPMIINYSLLSIEWNWNYINIYIYNHMYIYSKGFDQFCPMSPKKGPNLSQGHQFGGPWGGRGVVRLAPPPRPGTLGDRGAATAGGGGRRRTAQGPWQRKGQRTADGVVDDSLVNIQQTMENHNF